MNQLYRYRDLIATLVQRRGKILGGRHEDIDETDSGTWWEIPGVRTKSGRPSRVYLVPLTLELLRRIPDVGPWLFPWPRLDFKRREGQRLHDVRKATFRARRHSGITDWSLKTLRATLASRMAEIGIEPFTISQVLNHASSGAAKVTRDHYINPSVAKYQHATQKKAAMLKYANRLALELDLERSKVLEFPG